MSGSLTDEQRRKIDENRRKALEKRAARLNQSKQPTNSALTLNKDLVGTESFGSSSFHSVVRQSNPTRQTWGSEDGSSAARPFPGQASSESKYTAKTTAAATATQNINETSTSQTNSIQDFVSKFARPGSSKSSHSTSEKGKVDDFSSSKNRSERNQGNDNVCGVPGLGASKDVKVIKASCVLVSKNRFSVKARYDAQLIGLFKTIPSRNYVTSAKSLQPNVYIEGLPKTVLSVFTKTTPGTLKELSTQDINLNSVDSKLVSALMPFQKQGVSFCIRHDGRALIADDMGLGKTIQAICVASYYRKEWPLLVITPSSVRITWQQAIIRWLPSVDPQRVNVVLTGKDKPTYGLVNIISYDLLSKFTEQLKANPPRVIIADESHFIKNYKAARTKVALPLFKTATRVLLLSGTPALSRPMELYTQICAIHPRLFPSFHEFGLRYCSAMQNRWGWDYSGSSNMEELQLILEESIMIRRMKKEVLAELPSKRRQMVLLDPSLIKTKPLERAARQVAHAKEKDQHGALLNYFYETCASKMPAVREYVLDLLEGGHKLLVFAHHKDMLDAVSTCLTTKKYKFIRIDGDTPSSKRQVLCDKFQKQKDVLVAVLSITAANTGLTLTEGSAVVFAELFWNPGALVQAEDRVYRIGQKNSVNIHYLVAKATADDFLWPLIQGKLEVLNKAGLSGDDFSNADMTTFKDPKQKTLFSCFETLIEENAELDAVLSDALDQETSRAADGMTTNSMATTSIKDDDSRRTTDEDCEPTGQLVSSNRAKSIVLEENSKNNTAENTEDEDEDEEDLGFSWFTSLDDDELLCEQTWESSGSTIPGKKKSTFSLGGDDDETEPSPKRSKR